MSVREACLTKITKELGEYLEQIYNSNHNLIKLNFEWETATLELAEMKQETKLYNWLYPIEFSSKLAFIIEIIQNNMNYILLNREKTLELICVELEIPQDCFYNSIEEIQDLFIKFGKVKICKDGKIIIMNDIL